MKTKIKVKDLSIALKFLKNNSQEEWCDILINEDNERCYISFTDIQKNIARIEIYPATQNVTPRKIITTLLYDKE